MVKGVGTSPRKSIVVVSLEPPKKSGRAMDHKRNENREEPTLKMWKMSKERKSSITRKTMVRHCQATMSIKQCGGDSVPRERYASPPPTNTPSNKHPLQQSSHRERFTPNTPNNGVERRIGTDHRRVMLEPPQATRSRRG